MQDLWRIFSVFGGLESLSIQEGDDRYAFVNFFSTASANHAFSELGTESGERNAGAPSLYGKQLKLRRRYTRRDREVGTRCDWLSASEAVALANRLFGFNGWLSSVRELQPLVTVQVASHGGEPGQGLEYREARDEARAGTLEA